MTEPSNVSCFYAWEATVALVKDRLLYSELVEGIRRDKDVGLLDVDEAAYLVEALHVRMESIKMMDFLHTYSTRTETFNARAFCQAASAITRAK